MTCDGDKRVGHDINFFLFSFTILGFIVGSFLPFATVKSQES